MSPVLVAKPRYRVKAGSVPVVTSAPQPKPQARFDATQSSRRLKSWYASAENLNSLLAYAGEELVRRSRDLVRNNPYAASACDKYSAYAIGTGIKPSSLVKNAAIKAAIEQAWLDWTDEADADGITDLYGLQLLAAREVFEAGECFIRFRDRFVEDGLTVPLQLQLLEAEMLDYTLNRQEANGNITRLGIEMDRLGRRVAYWFFTRHPGDGTDFVNVTGEYWKRVPASEVCHVFRPLRAGQLRGVPMMTPAMVRMRLLDDFDDAALERKRQNARVSGWLTKPAVENEEVAASSEDRFIDWSPGSVHELLPGENFEVSQPADDGRSYEPFQYRNTTAISAVTGLAYHSVTGDTSKSNYTSTRAGTLDSKRVIEPQQHGMYVFQMCRPIWNRWFAKALLVGLINIGKRLKPNDARRVKHIPTKWDWTDPLKDRQAEKIAVEMGWKSRSDVIEAEGYDATEVDERIAQDQEREIRLKLKLGPRAAPIAAPQEPQENKPAEPEPATPPPSAEE